MSIDRQTAGITILRIFIGVFFVFEGLGKIRWFSDPSLLAGQLHEWLGSVPPSSLSHAYLEKFAIPGVRVFARLVPLGELLSGAALVFGVWPRLFALIAFVMALNFHVASGALFKYSFLTNGYGLPVLGSTLAVVFAAAANRAPKRVAKAAKM
ncbi:MAG TPA: DoxX family protein [Vicinamibacterales bacterium]|nr:DoxX family protein [Vicinamibacterales bacterium]